MHIIFITILLVAAYALGQDSPLYNIAASGLLAFILGALYGYLALPELCAVWLLLFIGLQFLLPMAEGKMVMIGYQSKHFAWAVAVA